MLSDILVWWIHRFEVHDYLNMSVSESSTSDPMYEALGTASEIQNTSYSFCLLFSFQLSLGF